MHDSFLCWDPEIPLALRTVAEDLAAAERSSNAGAPAEAAGQPQRFWRSGRTLRVRFLDGEELADRVLTAASAWTRHADLEFVHVTSGDAEIRVTFEGVGNWSALGTDALLTQVFPPDAPTLCLSELPSAISSSRVDRLARHEFGHALGLIHEHSSPAAGIRWDREAVYAALAQPPNSWTREKVDHNVFRVYDRTTTNFTEFDPESVMLYAFPAEWTLDGVTFRENSTLSPRDEDFVRTHYARV